MKTVLVTGAGGFVGKNLIEVLRRCGGVNLVPFDLDSPAEALDAGLAAADVIVHLAGVNRPQDPGEFETGNAGFTDVLCGKLEQRGRNPKIIFASSVQAALDNPYGASKRLAEERLKVYAVRQNAGVVIFRFKNIFGKWCRPNYNSVVATFCNNIAHDLPLAITDPARDLELVHIDDVVQAIMRQVEDINVAPICDRFTSCADRKSVLPEEDRSQIGATSEGMQITSCADRKSVLPEEDRSQIGATSEGMQITSCADRKSVPLEEDRSQIGATLYAEVSPVYRVTLGALADTIRGFRESRKTHVLPEVGDRFVHALYSTYLSYLEPEAFEYSLEMRVDNRGALAEFIRTREAGQIFVSRTKPGAVRGHHFHHTKTEKFLVLEGEAVIRFRQIQGGAVVEKRVSGRVWEVVDILPGYTHSIENVGEMDLVTLFWASEPFDPARPDTYSETV